MAEKFLGGVRPGQTNVTIAAFFRSTTDNTELTGLDAADITAYYWRQGSTQTSITVSDLTAIDDAHSDGGFKETDATNMPGLYRFDVPDAAYVAGADWVVVSLKATGAFVYVERFNISSNPADLVAIDGAATNGNNAILKLKQLEIKNSAGNALVCESTGGNGNGIFCHGDGSGNGIYSESHTGTGMKLVGGTNAHGIQISGNGAGHGMDINGGLSSGDGINITGGGTGNGIYTEGGSGHGIYAWGTDGIRAEGFSNGNGINAIKAGTGKDILAADSNISVNVTQIDGNPTNDNTATLKLKQLDIRGGATDDAVIIMGGATSGSGISISTTDGAGIVINTTLGSGINVYSGGIGINVVTTTGYALDLISGNGMAVEIVSGGNNEPALGIYGAGSGSGVLITAGATGDGVKIKGGATSGRGIGIETTDGDGIGIYAQGLNGPAVRFESAAVEAMQIYGGTTAIDIAGGATGDGIKITTTDGNGINIIPAGNNNAGISVNAEATGAIGMRLTGNSYGLEISSNTSDGVYIDAVGNGVWISGDSAEAGVYIEGGATGHGIEIVGGATSGNGISIETTDGHGILSSANGSAKHAFMFTSAGGGGIYCQGGDDYSGIEANGGANGGYGMMVSGGLNGIGLRITGGGAASGVEVIAGATSGDGINITTTDGHGIGINSAGAGKYDINASNSNISVNVTQIDGNPTNDNSATLKLKRIDIDTGAGVGDEGVGILINSSSHGFRINTAADGIRVDATDGIPLSLNAAGNGNPAIYAVTTGSSAAGIEIGSLTSGNGIIITTTDGDGINISAAGAGKYDINAPNSDLGDMSIASLSAQAKADVNAEVDAALADINLDHLLKVAKDTDWATTVTKESVVDLITSMDTNQTFDRATDSLEGMKTSIGTIVPTSDTADSFTQTYGSVISGTYTDTYTDDNNRHILAPAAVNGLDVYYTFNCGVGRAPVSVAINGYFSGSTQYAEVYAYNYVTAAYDKLSNTTTRMNNVGAETNYTYSLNHDHMDSVSNPGDIRLRFVSPSTNTDNRLYLDRILVNTVNDSTGTIPAPASPQQIWEYTQRTLTSDTGEPIDVGGIADAVWDEARADHTSAGSFGEMVNANLTSIDSNPTNNNSATLALKNLSLIDSGVGTPLQIQSAVAAAVNIVSSLSDGILVSAAGDAVSIESTGIGDGVKIAAVNGHGIEVLGGSTSGDGIKIITTDGHGLNLSATGVGKYDINAPNSDLGVIGGDNSDVLAVLGTPADTDIATDIANIATTIGTPIVADDIFDEVVEGSTTFRQFLRGFASVLLNSSAGGGTTTVTFESLDGSKNRVVATVDANGNRTSVTLDLT